MLHAIAFSRPPVRRESPGLGALPMGRCFQWRESLGLGAASYGGPRRRSAASEAALPQTLRPTHDRSGKPNNASSPIPVPNARAAVVFCAPYCASCLDRRLHAQSPVPSALAARRITNSPPDERRRSIISSRRRRGTLAVPLLLLLPDPPAQAAEAGPGRTSGRLRCFCGSINDGAPPKRPSVMRTGAPTSPKGVFS
jgi:hypothetical protein